MWQPVGQTTMHISCPNCNNQFMVSQPITQVYPTINIQPNISRVDQYHPYHISESNSYSRPMNTFNRSRSVDNFRQDRGYVRDFKNEQKDSYYKRQDNPYVKRASEWKPYHRKTEAIKKAENYEKKNETFKNLLDNFIDKKLNEVNISSPISQPTKE
jgi:hypothetical protein